MNDWQRFFVLISMIATGTATIWFGSLAISTGAAIYWLLTVVAWLLTPYLYGLGRLESVRYPIGQYLSYLENWVVILIVSTIFAWVCLVGFRALGDILGLL
ncbi:MAG: hypothetical protein UW16_C0014G0023 [Microgenomates group bacterium GW2011_GWC1_44_10]|nr:MAG: hypothetical protein UW16_C0014G0023 [Microgenomates group bacterium GW2011_GWC1_44_10]